MGDLLLVERKGKARKGGGEKEMQRGGEENKRRVGK